MNQAIDKTDSEWQDELTPEQYHVLREKGTEPAFTGKYVEHHETGVYTCAACDNLLFDSDTKFDSNSGWPSYYDAIPGSVVLTPDDSLGMQRTEVTCARCGSHLGHLFEGEHFNNPTDKRFCINSISLAFEPRTDAGVFPESVGD